MEVAMAGRKWTEKEDKFLQKNYKNLGTHGCGQRLNRSPDAVLYRVRYLKEHGCELSNKNKFAPEEDEYLRKNYDNYGPTKCAKHLGRSPASVQARMLKYIKPGMNYRKLTPAEREQAISMYECGHDMYDLCEFFGAHSRDMRTVLRGAGS